MFGLCSDFGLCGEAVAIVVKHNGTPKWHPHEYQDSRFSSFMSSVLMLSLIILWMPSVVDFIMECYGFPI